MLACLAPRQVENEDVEIQPAVIDDVLIHTETDASLGKRYLVVSQTPLRVQRSSLLNSEETGLSLITGQTVDISEEDASKRMIDQSSVLRCRIARNKGWISECNGERKLLEYLCQSKEVTRHRVSSSLPIRVRQDLEEVCTLFPGDFVELCPGREVQNGAIRARRADGPGWVSVVSSKGEKLLVESKILMRMKVISSMQMNIREGAEITSEEVGTLHPGTIIEICDEQVLKNGTKRVLLADHSGWVTYISSGGIIYLDPICSLTAPLPVYLCVSSIPLRIRKTADVDSEEYSLQGKECTIPVGTAVEIAEVVNTCVTRLKLADGRGWITAVNRTGRVLALCIQY